jgi:hypothetical protein
MAWNPVAMYAMLVAARQAVSRFLPLSKLERGEGCVHWVVDRDPGSLCIGDGMDGMH